MQGTPVLLRSQSQDYDSYDLKNILDDLAEYSSEHNQMTALKTGYVSDEGFESSS